MLVMKSAFAALLLLQVFGHWHQVYSYENDDLVFDTDGKFAVEVPLIEKHEEGLIHRIKRGIADWFSPWKSIITTTTSPPTVTTTEVPKVESLQSSTIATNVRLIRNSGEVTDEHNNVEGNDDKDEDNDVGVVAAGHRQGFTEDDDEDWAGSGDADGSGTSEPEIPTVQPVGREAKFYRVTLTVLEPYIAEYADTQSPEFVELSSSLKQALVELLSRRIPNFDHFANVVKISPSEDPFDSEVTLNIGTTFTDESKIREVLENQLSYHSLGNVKVSPEGFTFRNFQEECNENSELRCRDGTCVPLTSRCDGTVQCPDQSDELDCPTVTVRPTEESSTEEESITEEPAPISRGGTNLYESVTRIAPTNNCRGDDSVRCTDGSRSICSVQKCDGIPDCDDAGDERDCGQSCGSGEFSCDVSRCILDRQRCDFIDDCEDQSDERDCNYPGK